MSKGSEREFTQYNAPYDPNQAIVTPGFVPYQPSFRDEQEARLQGYGLTGSTTIPDDTLGAVRSNVAQYSRGVHVGERLNTSAYLWPDEFNPNTGLKLEAQGKTWSPPGATPYANPLGGPDQVPGGAVNEINPERQSLLAPLLPSWR